MRREAGGGKTPQEEVVQRMWAAMEEVICPAECSIYSSSPDADMDPLSAEGKIGAFTSFFSPMAHFSECTSRTSTWPENAPRAPPFAMSEATHRVRCANEW